MSDDADFEPPRIVEPWASAGERAAWAAILFACTAPWQGLLDEGGRPGTLAVTSLAAAASIALLLTRGRATSAFRLATASWPYLLVVALTGAFALGAVDAHWSGVRWLTWLPCVGAAFCAAARLQPSQFAGAVLTVLTAAVVLSAATALVAPSHGIMGAAGAPIGEGSAGAWMGVYPTKNALGHTAGIALALILAFGRPTLGWGASLVGAIAAVACLVMARSASSVAIAVLLAGFCIFVLNGRGWIRIVALVVIAMAGAALLLSGGALVSHVTNWLGRDETLSGRTAIWRAAQPYVMQQPLIGSGYDYTGSPEVVGRLRGLFDVYSVHSGYLDAVITLGFGLSGLLVLTVGLALRRAWREPAWPGEHRRGIATALLVGGLLSAVTEEGITHPSGPMQMLWLLALFGLFAGA